MKIAFILGSLDIGGTETQACRLARELSLLGHTVNVLVLGPSGPLAGDLRSDGIEFEAFDYRGPFRRDSAGRRSLQVRELVKLAAFARRLRKLEPDVCHAFLYWSYVLGLPVAATVRTPVRISGRRGLKRSAHAGRTRARLERFSNRFAHVILANSDAVARDVIRTEAVDPGKVHVIRNGVDVPCNQADVEREPVVGLMVANLIAYKGHADVVTALSLLDNPPVIRMIGVGPECERIRALVARHGLGSTVRLEGSIPRAARLFQDAQFAVVASHEEGLPNVVIEAMAAGLPVVATNVGGIPELVEDGVEGLLVAPHDPEALSAAIDRVVSDRRLRQRLSNAGRARARDFAWDRCVRAHVDLYERLMTRAR